MTITQNKEGSKLNIAIEGRLDTITAPEFDALITDMEGVTEAALDFEKLEYVSSAGLRVLLKANKKLSGNMTVTNVCETVMEVFKITGFAKILKII